MAAPITYPRSVRGEAAMTQVSAPPQMQPEATPWSTRRTSSVTMSPANPNAATPTANATSPVSVVRRTPTRAASQPPSTPPGISPAA
jgi:hypothetical protein